MNKASVSEKPLILSHLALRRAIGVLGAVLPVAVGLGAFLINRTELQSSISHYYYTVMRNYLVGTLWAIGFFLMFYKGYECADAVASRLGGLFAIGASLFPTALEFNPTVDAQWIGRMHYAFAALFFITLAYMSIFLFTKTDPDKTKKPTSKKLQRNRIYYGCGITMLVCLLLIGLYILFFDKPGTPLQKYNLIFWLEALAVVVFGISWLIKGETLWKDNNGPEIDQPSDAVH